MFAFKWVYRSQLVALWTTLDMSCHSMTITTAKTNFFIHGAVI